MALRGKSSDIALRGVPTESLGEECVSLMAQRLESVAASRDVPTLSKRVGRTAQIRRWENNAALKDVPI